MTLVPAELYAARIVGRIAVFQMHMAVTRMHSMSSVQFSDIQPDPTFEIL